MKRNVTLLASLILLATSFIYRYIASIKLTTNKSAHITVEVPPELVPLAYCYVENMSEYICAYYDLDVKNGEKVHESELGV